MCFLLFKCFSFNKSQLYTYANKQLKYIMFDGAPHKTFNKFIRVSLFNDRQLQ